MFSHYNSFLFLLAFFRYARLNPSAINVLVCGIRSHISTCGLGDDWNSLFVNCVFVYDHYVLCNYKNKANWLSNYEAEKQAGKRVPWPTLILFSRIFKSYINCVQEHHQPALCNEIMLWDGHQRYAEGNWTQVVRGMWASFCST